jgi:hypothetical protein
MSALTRWEPTTRWNPYQQLVQGTARILHIEVLGAQCDSFALFTFLLLRPITPTPARSSCVMDQPPQSDRLNRRIQR